MKKLLLFFCLPLFIFADSTDDFFDQPLNRLDLEKRSPLNVKSPAELSYLNPSFDLDAYSKAFLDTRTVAEKEKDEGSAPSLYALDGKPFFYGPTCFSFEATPLSHEQKTDLIALALFEKQPVITPSNPSSFLPEPFFAAGSILNGIQQILNSAGLSNTVPEPGTYLLLGSFLILLHIKKSKRKTV